MTWPVVLSSRALVSNLGPWAASLQALWLVRTVGIELQGSSKLIWKENSHFGRFKLKELTKVGFLSKRPRNRDSKVLEGSYDDFGFGRMSGQGFGRPRNIWHLLWKLAFWKNLISLGWSAFQCYQCLFGIPSVEIVPYGDSGIGSTIESEFGGPWVILGSFG